jgi:hypothetical protein
MASSVRDESLDRPGQLKDRFEWLWARAEQVRTLGDFCKWSVFGGLTGIVASVGVIAFNSLLVASTTGFDRLAAATPDPRLVMVVPALGGLAVGLIRHFWLPEDPYSFADSWFGGQRRSRVSDGSDRHRLRLAGRAGDRETAAAQVPPPQLRRG